MSIRCGPGSNTDSPPSPTKPLGRRQRLQPRNPDAIRDANVDLHAGPEPTVSGEALSSGHQRGIEQSDSEGSPYGWAPKLAASVDVADPTLSTALRFESAKTRKVGVSDREMLSRAATIRRLCRP